MFYSDYHRELSWNSWLKNKANGINEHADDVRELMNRLVDILLTRRYIYNFLWGFQYF